jgi:hypothetical protein
LIRRLRDEVEERGARLVVMVAPLEGQVYPDRFAALWDQHFPGRAYDLEKPNRVLADFLAAEHIRGLDLLPVLRARARAGEAALYRRGDGHWSARGHEVVGEALLGFLEREGFLVPRTAG